MKFRRYDNVDAYKADVLDILLEDEVCNNLPVSIITDGNVKNSADWFLGAVTDDHGMIVLAAQCVKPFNLLLYEPAGKRQGSSVELLAGELRRIGYRPPGVFAVTELARSFTEVFYGRLEDCRSTTMVLMRLDKLAHYKKAPGFCRMLTAEDMSFIPAWEQAFCIDCNVPSLPLSVNEERIRTRIGKDTHFIWEDGLPVSQAVNGRDTHNGAVVNWVYTPPSYRGRGYATSVVAELSRSLLDKGKLYCCLFADADNPASRSVYHKLGYYDVCEFEQIEFDTGRRLT